MGTHSGEITLTFPVFLASATDFSFNQLIFHEWDAFPRKANRMSQKFLPFLNIAKTCWKCINPPLFLYRNSVTRECYESVSISSLHVLSVLLSINSQY